MIGSQAKNCFIRCLCSKRNDALLLSLAVFVALAPPTRGHAAPPADPSGHWEGAITGTLSTNNTEITGTFGEGPIQQPMTFRRAAAAR